MMKRRLRKKLHIGEFREMGIEVEARLDHEPTTEELDAFIDDIEAAGMMCGGGCGVDFGMVFERCRCRESRAAGKRRWRCGGDMDDGHLGAILDIMGRRLGRFVLLGSELFDTFNDELPSWRRRKG